MLQNNKFCSNKTVFQNRYIGTLLTILFVLFLSACSDEAVVTTERGSSQKGLDGTTLYLRLEDDNKALVRSLARGKTASVVAVLIGPDGNPIEGEVITFETDLGTLAADNGLTNSLGQAKTNIASGTVAKAGEITATVNVNGADISVSYGFEVSGAADTTPGSSPNPDPTPDVSQSKNGALSFVSATPNRITLKSTGGEGLSELSTVTFKLEGTDGLPLANQTVDFTIDNPIGGISIEPTSATTGFDGIVSTVVHAGTVPTSVRIRATTKITDGTTENIISTQSDMLAVGVGTPDQNSMSLSISNFAPEAWNYNGEEVDVTVRLADHFNNFIPDGTKVYFTTEGGAIDSSCETVDSACTVKWVSSNPRPADHRVTILATTLGSESFVDTDSDGVYSLADGEPFADVNSNGVYDEAFTDTNGNGIFDEPFTDTNGNGQYDLQERFVDYNGNGVYDGDRVTVAGETTFVDSNNGNGLFDGSGYMPNGETTAPEYQNDDGLFNGPGFADLGEPYLDANENKKRDVDEIYFDTNGDATYSPNGDGKYNGIHCKQGEAICASQKTLRIRKSAVLVMAGSNAYAAIVHNETGDIYYSDIPGVVANSPTNVLDVTDSSASITVYFADSAGQVLPWGTTVSVKSDLGKVSGAPSGDLPNYFPGRLPRGSAASQSELMFNGLYGFSFGISDADPSKQEPGLLEITFTTPKGVATTFFLNVLM